MPAVPLSPAALEFVALPAGAEALRGEAATLQLSFTQPGGGEWCLRGNPSTEQLQVFVSVLRAAAR